MCHSCSWRLEVDMQRFVENLVSYFGIRWSCAIHMATSPCLSLVVTGRVLDCGMELAASVVVVSPVLQNQINSAAEAFLPVSFQNNCYTTKQSWAHPAKHFRTIDGPLKQLIPNKSSSHLLNMFQNCIILNIFPFFKTTTTPFNPRSWTNSQRC